MMDKSDILIAIPFVLIIAGIITFFGGALISICAQPNIVTCRGSIDKIVENGGHYNIRVLDGYNSAWVHTDSLNYKGNQLTEMDTYTLSYYYENNWLTIEPYDNGVSPFLFIGLICLVAGSTGFAILMMVVKDC